MSAVTEILEQIGQEGEDAEIIAVINDVCAFLGVMVKGRYQRAVHKALEHSVIHRREGTPT